MSLDVYLNQGDICVYQSNITHNLNDMAIAVSEEFYKAIWRPEEINKIKAREIVDILISGISELADNRNKYEKFNPSNGWGSYDGLLSFASDYLAACCKNPNATIEVSR